jgi:hypothetical protein
MIDGSWKFSDAPSNPVRATRPSAFTAFNDWDTVECPPTSTTISTPLLFGVRDSATSPQFGVVL